MRILPSIPASIYTGVVIIPFSVWLIDNSPSWAVLPIMIFGMGLPVFFSAFDYRYVFQSLSKREMYELFEHPKERYEKLFSEPDFQEYMVGTGARMIILFISTVVSILLYKQYGVEL